MITVHRHTLMQKQKYSADVLCAFQPHENREGCPYKTDGEPREKPGYKRQEKEYRQKRDVISREKRADI